MANPIHSTPVAVGPRQLKGILGIPHHPLGLVIFAHGSGSGRLSPRNQHVAHGLQTAGFATLLLDLLTPTEEANRANVFDMELLASRLVEASDWAARQPELADLPTGYFGASTGAGAAMRAAARPGSRIGAIVSRGGRPDLAAAALSQVRAPTLLLVGSLDEPVISLNRQALARMQCPRQLTIIRGASHLFEEPGTLDEVIDHARDWFMRNLRRDSVGTPVRLPLADRRTAGRALADRLTHLREADPLILALPRGGVPVAHEIAEALDADLDLLLVRKLGAPGLPEVGLGAVVDGDPPQVVLNERIVQSIRPSKDYIDAELGRQLLELGRRRRLYLGGRPPLAATDRVVVVVDDGIATGGTVAAALRGLSKSNPAQIILAVPVAPREVLASLASACDDIVCLATPEPFGSVGQHYRDFEQTSDEEVIRLLDSLRLGAPA